MPAGVLAPYAARTAPTEAARCFGGRIVVDGTTGSQDELSGREKPGAESGARLAISGGNLQRIAASVRIARLPGEITATKGDDVRDVLARPDGITLVRTAIAAAEPWQPREGEHDPRDGRPQVTLTLAYGSVTDQVTAQLGKLGWESPWLPPVKRDRLKLYHRGGALVHVVTEAKPVALPGGVTAQGGIASIRPLPIGQLPLRIADAVQLMTQKMTPDGPEQIPAVLLDNVDSVLGSPSLDAALTGLTWSDRLLGNR